MEQKIVTERVKAAWAGGRGGKLRDVQPTDDPRLFLVTTHGAFDAEKAKLGGHGLTIESATPDMFSSDWHVTVRIMDGLWDKLTAIPGAVSIQDSADPIAAALKLLEAHTPPALAEALQTLRGAIQDTQTLRDENQRLTTYVERLEGAQDDDLAQITMLNAQLKAIADAPDSLLIYERVEHPNTKAEALMTAQAKGYTPEMETFVPSPEGKPIYCARLVRRTKPATPPLRSLGKVGAFALTSPEPNGNTSDQIDLRGGSRLADRLREQQAQDDAALTPELTQMAQVLHER